MWASPPKLVWNSQPITANSFPHHRNRLIITRCASNFPLASKILVKNLTYSTSETGLHKEFSNFGQITEVKLVKDKSTEKSKGYAFIQYTSQEDAMTALENMDHQILDGRTIYVEIARPGKDLLRGRPITSGPPKTLKNQYSEEQDEVSDCWY